MLVRDVPIPPHGTVFVEIAFAPAGDLPQGRRYAVDLLQHVRETVLGNRYLN